MPELPEVEAVCRKLRAAVEGATITRFRLERPGIVKPQEPTAIEAAVAGTRLLAVVRRGKNILLHLSNQQSLHVHLRMTGNLYAVPDPRFRPVGTRAWWELEGGRGILFEDSRALGRIHLYPTADLMARMDSQIGVEPLSEAFTPELLMEAAKGSRRPAKLFLMDQHPIAGLGNIYAAEVLFRSRIHPALPMGKLSKPKLRALYRDIRHVMEEAVASAAAAYDEPGRFAEGESFPCAVYDREDEPCTICYRRIRRIPQGGRSTYFCPGCQRR